MCSEYRTKRPIILRNYPSDIFLSVPVRNKFKKRLNLNYKKAKSLLVWLMKSDIPSLSFLIFGQYFGITRVFFLQKKFRIRNPDLGWGI